MIFSSVDRIKKGTASIYCFSATYELNAFNTTLTITKS